MTSSQRISTLCHTPEEKISNSSIFLKIATKTLKKPLRNFMERELGFRNTRSVEIQRVYRLNRRNDTDPRPIIARFLRYKDVEEIFTLGRRLEGTNFQMFRDLPREIVKRRKDQMAVLKKARRNCMRASFSRSQPDNLYINGDFWPVGKALEGDEQLCCVLIISISP